MERETAYWYSSEGRCSTAPETVGSGTKVYEKPRGYVMVHQGVEPLYVSEAWAMLHGYTQAEILSMPSIEPLYHPDDRGRIAAYRMRRAAGRYAPDRYAYRALHKDGSSIWIDIAVESVQWKGEEVTMCTASVTEARRAKDDVRTYASALEQVVDCVSIVDKNYRYHFVNDAVLRFYNERREDILGRHVIEFVGEEVFNERSKPDLDQCFAGQSVYTEMVLRNADGDMRYLDGTLTPFRGSEGSIIGAIVVLRDVTEAMKRRGELKIVRSAIDQIDERVIIFDHDERVRFVNKRSADFYGRHADDVVGKPLADVLGWDRHPDGGTLKGQEASKLALKQGKASRYQYWRTGVDGRARFWETSVVPYREADSTISGAIATSRDRTEHFQAEQVRERFKNAIENLSDGYALFDVNERLVAYNHFYERMHSSFMSTFGIGLAFETILRSRVTSGSVLDAIGREDEWITERLANFRSEFYIGDIRLAGGRLLHLRNRRTADGGTLLIAADITESKRIEEALAESQSRFKDFSELAADWFWEQDVEGRYTYVSESIEILTKRPALELLGKTSIEVFGSSVLKDPAWRELWRELSTTRMERTAEVEHDLTGADSKVYRVRSVTRPIRNAAGVTIGYRGAARNITAAHLLEKQLERQANYDALTGLLNRRSFERHLEKAMKAGSGEPRRSSSFCFIDLDQFKLVNDTAGHLAGDRLLKQVAALLEGKIRKGDILARLGGDEFGLLLHNCSLRRAQNVARMLLDALNEDRFFHNDYVFEIGASIGVTSITSTSHRSVSQIFAEADLACYAAKDEGRNRVQVYQADDRQLSRRREEMSKASLIRWALDENRFVLFAQPILPLADQGDNSPYYEVLLRLVRQDGSLDTPDKFIPAAENYGLMAQIDRWVIKQSLAMLAERPDYRININLSGVSLNEGALVGFIRRLLLASPIAPENVCFEITETAAIRSLSKTKSLISELKQIGCSFALDDFGSGLSSFSYLKQLPVDYLKIDGSFIRDCLSDKRSRTMVEAIHHVAKSLSLQTVAECVETEETAEILREIGVDFSQGYVVGKPEPLEKCFEPSRVIVARS